MLGQNRYEKIVGGGGDVAGGHPSGGGGRKTSLKGEEDFGLRKTGVEEGERGAGKKTYFYSLRVLAAPLVAGRRVKTDSFLRKKRRSWELVKPGGGV